MSHWMSHEGGREGRQVGAGAGRGEREIEIRELSLADWGRSGLRQALAGQLGTRSANQSGWAWTERQWARKPMPPQEDE